MKASLLAILYLRIFYFLYAYPTKIWTDLKGLFKKGLRNCSSSNGLELDLFKSITGSDFSLISEWSHTNDNVLEFSDIHKQNEIQ